MRPTLAFLALLAVNTTVDAGIKKCVDKLGNVTYTDQPCATNTLQTDVVVESSQPPPPPPPQSPRSSPPIVPQTRAQSRPAPASDATDYEHSKEYLCEVARKERSEGSLRACSKASGFKASSSWIQYSQDAEREGTLKVGVKCVAVDEPLTIVQEPPLGKGMPASFGRAAHPPGRFAERRGGPDFASWEDAAEILCGNRAQAAEPDGSREQRMRGAELVDSACGGRDTEVMAMLAQGVSPNGRSFEHDFSALHCAALLGDVPLIQALHGRGAKLGAIASDYALKPIHLAALSPSVDALRVLNRLGASVDASSLAGTPVMMAMTPAFGSYLPSDVERQISRDTIRKKRDAGPSRLDVLRAFIALGAKLDGINDRGENLLHLAVQSQDLELTKFLLDGKFKPNVRDAFGEPALHMALHDITDSKFDRGVESMNARRQIGLLLLDRGADINARDARGATVQCGVQGDTALLMQLFKRGLDPNVADAEGSTCWYKPIYRLRDAELAAWFDQLPTLRTPRRPDGSLGAGPLYAAAEATDVEAVKYFLKRGLKPLDVGSYGYTIMHAVARSSGGEGDHDARRREIVKLLIAAGAKQNEHDEGGSTPLMVARIHDEAFIVFLIEQGADVNAVNSHSGQSVLNLYEGFHSKPAVVAALKARGAQNTPARVSHSLEP
jgi:ankyrin repeat protein